MKTKFKLSSRILSLVLALVMVLGTMSMTRFTVFAAEPTPYDGTPVAPQQISFSNYESLGLRDAELNRFDGYYAIRDAKELYGFVTVVRNREIANHYEPVNAVLLQDIVVNEEVSAAGARHIWTPIESYIGTFDGNGHSISGLYFNDAEAIDVGLFGMVGRDGYRGTTIRNVVLENSYLHGNENVGGIAGQVHGDTVTISNCKVADDVFLQSTTDDYGAYIGGIVGFAHDYGIGAANNVVQNCVVTGTVYAKGEKVTHAVGAIVGFYQDDANAKKHIVAENCYYRSGCASAENESRTFGMGGSSETRTNEGCVILDESLTHTQCVYVTMLATNATCLYGGYASGDYCLICERNISASAKDPTLHSATAKYDNLSNSTHDISYSCCGEKVTGEAHDFYMDACRKCMHVCQHPGISSGGDSICEYCGETVTGITYICPVWDEETNSLRVTTEVASTYNDAGFWISVASALPAGWSYLSTDVETSGLEIVGTVHLILADGVTLNVEQIRVPNDTSLHIYSRSADADTAGRIVISGTEEYSIVLNSGSSVTINGGNIDANRGINMKSNTEFTVNGGVVEAAGADYQAGIGSGLNEGYTDYRVVIHGGTVTAQGGSGAAGIGGGHGSPGGSVSITGGNVCALTYDEYAQPVGYGRGNSTSGTLTDGDGNAVVLSELTLADTPAGTAITSAEGIGTYGLRNVYTLADKTDEKASKLYFYLPENTAISSLTAGDVEYVCKDNTNTYYSTHNWSKADGVCARCGENCEHSNITDAICNTCGSVFHTHEWEYTVSGSTITATCKNSDGHCSDTNGGSVTISAPSSLTYTGSKIEAVVDNQLTTVADVAVVYTGEGLVEGKPVKPGTYTAAITLGDVTVSVDYTIAECPHDSFTNSDCDHCDYVCLHGKKTYTPNADGTKHDATCADCGATVGESEGHTFDAETGKCGLCSANMAAASVTIGDTTTYYEEIAEAITKAQSGESTLTLQKDATVKYLTVRNGSVLDLNGYALTADYFTSYGTVVDGETGGNGLVLVVKDIHVAGDNGFLPIYDSANGGYRFYKYELQNLGSKAVADRPDAVKFGFRLVLSNPAGYDVLSTTTDAKVDLTVSVSWTGSTGALQYTFRKTTLRSYGVLVAADIAKTGTSDKAITLTITGLDALEAGTEISVQPTITSAPGTEACGETRTWTVQ